MWIRNGDGLSPHYLYGLSCFLIILIVLHYLHILNEDLPYFKVYDFRISFVTVQTNSKLSFL
jgi:hypothetical protein